MNKDSELKTEDQRSNAVQDTSGSSLAQNPLLSDVFFTAEEMIAFRDRDIENDIWSEVAFLFKNRDDVKEFFNSDNSILLDIYTDGDDERILNDFKIYNGNPAGHITAVSFNTKYAGDVNLYEMERGFVCNIR